MQTLKIIINREPMASPRPRFTTKGKYVHSYMPKDYVAEKEIIASSIKRVYGDKLLLNSKLELSIVFYMKMPNSWSNSKKALLAGTYHTNKPDLDNLVKTYKDCMNGIIYEDDRRISKYSEVKKIYSFKPRVEIEIKEMGD